MCMGVLPTYVSVGRVPCGEPEENLRSPETGTTNGYTLPCGYWELSPGPPGRATSVLNLSATSAAQALFHIGFQ